MRLAVKLSLLVFCLNLGAAIARADMLDRTVAVVNGDIILYSEVVERVKIVQTAMPELKDADPARMAQLEKEVLQQLVRERLAAEEVKRLKITVAKSEVDQAYEDFKRNNRFSDAQMDAFVQQTGQTPKQFREGLTRELERNRLVERVLSSKTIITEEQVTAAMNSGQSFSPPKVEKPSPSKSQQSTIDKLRLSIIFVPAREGAGGQKDAEKLAREILGKIKSGEDFGAMARKYSKGPAAQDGGDIGFLAGDELAPHIATAIKGLKKNQVSDVVKGEDGYYLVKVMDSKAEKPVAVAAASAGAGGETPDRARVRRMLFQKEVDRKFQEWVQELESKAFIKISL